MLPFNHVFSTLAFVAGRAYDRWKMWRVRRAWRRAMKQTLRAAAESRATTGR